jgi:hypothetical protein
LKSRSTPEAIPQSEHEYLRKRFEELKPRYQVGRDWYFRLLKELKKSHPELPERPSIKGMALLVGMSEDYDAYQTLSLVTHPSAVIDHVFMWEDGRFSMGPKFDRDMALTSVALTVNFAHIVFEQILTHIGTEKAVAMIQYSKMLNYQAQRTFLELLSRPLPIKKTNVDEANSGIHH